jgi:hypothetical protein
LRLEFPLISSNPGIDRAKYGACFYSCRSAVSNRLM